jgi:hypothetical protein
MVSLTFQAELNNETSKQSFQEKNFEIDKILCMNSLRKITQGDFSSFSEIDDVEMHIQNLRNEIS